MKRCARKNYFYTPLRTLTVTIRSLKLNLLTVAVAAAFPLQGAYAQSTAPEASATTGQLQAVIVTASRRSENIKDVPQSISTLSADPGRGAAVSPSTGVKQ